MIGSDFTLRNERRDFVEWHRGRAPYVLWALDLDLPPVRARVAAAARHLDGLLLDGYRRQPHLTLSLRGFPAGAAPADDEHTAAGLAADLAALRAAAPAPFGCRLGGLDSFPSAPFLAVDDPDEGISALRRCLPGVDYPGFCYVPHVTVGLYAGAWPAADVRRRLAAWDGGAALACTVGAVSLLAYEPSDIGGPLRCLGRFCLASRTWTGD